MIFNATYTLGALLMVALDAFILGHALALVVALKRWKVRWVAWGLPMSLIGCASVYRWGLDAYVLVSHTSHAGGFVAENVPVSVSWLSFCVVLGISYELATVLLGRVMGRRGL